MTRMKPWYLRMPRVILFGSMKLLRECAVTIFESCWAAMLIFFCKDPKRIKRRKPESEGLKQAVSGELLAPIFARISGADEEEAHASLSGSRISVFTNAEEAVLAAVKGASA